jgi:hypothetical protein
VKSKYIMMCGVSPHQELNVSGLRLNSVVESTFSRLKKLRLLDLRGNNLRQLPHSALASPPALREVFLSGKRHLAPWSTLLPNKLVTKFFAYYKAPRFITVFTSARHCSLSRARWSRYPDILQNPDFRYHIHSSPSLIQVQ